MLFHKKQEKEKKSIVRIFILGLTLTITPPIHTRTYAHMGAHTLTHTHKHTHQYLKPKPVNVRYMCLQHGFVDLIERLKCIALFSIVIMTILVDCILHACLFTTVLWSV